MYSPPTNYTAPGDGVTLQQIIVIHRHGDRAPISPSAGTVVLDGEMWEPRLPTAEERRVGVVRGGKTGLKISFDSVKLHFINILCDGFYSKGRETD